MIDLGGEFLKLLLPLNNCERRILDDYEFISQMKSTLLPSGSCIIVNIAKYHKREITTRQHILDTIPISSKSAQ